MQLDDLDFADDLALLSQTQQQMQEKTTSVTAASAAVGKARFSDTTQHAPIQSRLTEKIWKIHYLQQPAVRENKPDFSRGRNQEEAVEVDRTHIEESTELRHKTSSRMESSRPKEEGKTKEHITPRNGDRHEKNKQKLDRTGKEDGGQSGMENAGRKPTLHWE
ncbi:unnamed protein product [Schistosoma margrebowiei]|uniref:Uncharacterized protein n=1 Tax=Schistosoma margrebowiei TaxID=48269 RepID=A0A183MKM7_9TREM|nr:unnamed protein product [Schistosoma margrebowiei]